MGQEVGQRMQHQRDMALLQRRREAIRELLDDEAPYTESDQRHLDPHTPERAYWHHGYQAALNDIIDLLDPVTRKSGSAGIPS